MAPSPGEEVIYPGHPTVLAFLITQVFKTYEEAFVRTESNVYAALGSMDVPGAGGNVYAALDLLGRLHDGVPPKEALYIADNFWDRQSSQTTDNTDKWRAGQSQAERYKPRLLAMSAWWKP
jgi:hypothetical protein